MSISKELQKKLDYYEQVYFAMDTPIPFRDGLVLYPVLVKDYYNFYNSIPCLTFDKSIKTIMGPDGRPQKTTDADGIRMNNLSYLIKKMESEEEGQITIMQVMQLFELIFHIQRGIFCPNCGKQLTYEEAFSNLDERTKALVEDLKVKIQEEYHQEQISQGEEPKDLEFDEEMEKNLYKLAQSQAMRETYTCPDCQAQMRDIFAIKNDDGKKTLTILKYEFTAKDFDELKALVPRQNILDYDADKYINPDLKEELELKAMLKNSDYTSPTLEKQMVCVVASTGYTFEEIQQKMTIRKLAFLLRTIDRKNTYYAQLQGQMSGMVSFKEDPKHWIFGDDKRNIKDELTDYGQFEKKFKDVV